MHLQTLISSHCSLSVQITFENEQNSAVVVHIVVYVYIQHIPQL